MYIYKQCINFKLFKFFIIIVIKKTKKKIILRRILHISYVFITNFDSQRNWLFFPRCANFQLPPQSVYSLTKCSIFNFKRVYIPGVDRRTHAWLNFHTHPLCRSPKRGCFCHRCRLWIDASMLLHTTSRAISIRLREFSILTKKLFTLKSAILRVINNCKENEW